MALSWNKITRNILVTSAIVLTVELPGTVSLDQYAITS